MSWQNDPIVPPSPGRPEAPWERDALVGPTTRQTLTTAVTMKAEAVAEAERLAKRYPAPPEVIMQDLEAYRLQEVIDLADADLQKAPMLREILRRDVRKAALAQDDIPTLAKIESNFAKVAAASAGQAVLGISEGIWRTPDAAQRAVGYLAETVEKTGLPRYLNPIRGVQDVLRFVSEGRVPALGSMGGTTTIADRVNEAQKILTDRETFGNAFADVQTLAQNADKALATAIKTGQVEQVGQVLTDPNYWAAFLAQAVPSLYLAIKSGGSVAFMGWLEGMEQAGNAAEFEQKTGQKISDADFTQAVAQTAIVNALLERYGLDKVLGAKGNGLKGIAKAMGGEGGTEALQQINSNLAALLAYNPEQPLSEGVLQSLMGGVGAGGGVSIAQQAGAAVQAQLGKQARQVDAAQKNSEQLQQAMQVAGQSLLRERSPEQFRALMGEMTDGTIYVDGEVLNQLPPEVLAALPEAVREQIPTAAEIGSVVEIPVADVLTIAPGTPLEQVFMQNARTSPDAPSLAEAEEAGKKAQEFLQQEAARVIAQAQDQEALRQSQEAVKQNIRQQLAATGRFRDTVNEGYATWAAAFYTAYGSRLGMTPEQFYQRYPLRVLGAAQGQQTGVLNAGAPAVDLGGRQISITLNRQDEQAGFTLVPVNTAAFDAGFRAADTEFTAGMYVGPGGTGAAIGDRYQRFGEFAATAPSIEAPTVSVDAQGRVSFGNGRHRFAFMRDSGVPSVPVAMDEESLQNAIAAGYVTRGVLNQAAVERLQMVAERGQREIGSRAIVSAEERQAIQASAKATGLPAAEIEAAVRAHKLAHPVAQGWEPLVYVRTIVEDGKAQHQYKNVPYSFSSDAEGKQLEPGSANYARRVNAAAKAMVEEVRSVFRRAAAGDKNAQNILAQAGWYKAMRARLRKEFGGLGDLFADLLGATSPNTPVRDNWFNAVDALRRASRGDFDTLIPKWEAWADNLDAAETSLRAWVNENLERLTAEQQATEPDRLRRLVEIDDAVAAARKEYETRRLAEEQQNPTGFRREKDGTVTDEPKAKTVAEIRAEQGWKDLNRNAEKKAIRDEAAKYSKRALLTSDEYQQRLDVVRAAREIPENLLPTKESGAKYGFNGKNVIRAMVDLWRIVKNADPDIARGGTAPKALNFSGNLIGFRERATIDVWAARMLQRLTGGRRVPSMAETGVSGEMREDGTTTLQFGFGQDVFNKAAEAIRNDDQLKTDDTLAQINDDDLQAVVWFVEKELWTVNDWTNAAGEGGSFELEANLTGTSQQARVKELRTIIDASPPSADVTTAAQDTTAARQAIEEHERTYAAEIEELRKLTNNEIAPYKGSVKRKEDLQKLVRPPADAVKLLAAVDRAKGRLEEFNARKVAAKAELAALEREVDRFVGGLSIQMSRETQGVDFVPTDADMARLAAGIRRSIYETDNGATVLGSKAVSTEGRYGGVERSFDLEVVAREGYDANKLWLEMLRQAQAAKQDSTFLSRVLRENEAVDPLRHRPGVEIYFRSASAQAQLETMLAELAKEGVEFLTVIVDGRRLADATSGAMPAAVGVRLQYVPEFEQRYGMDDFSGLDDVALAAKMKGKADELDRLAARVAASVEGVSFAGQFWYDTQVAFGHEYQEKIDALTTGTAQGEAAQAGGGIWAGQPIRAGLESADRQSRETAGGQPGADVLGGDAQRAELAQASVAEGAPPAADTLRQSDRDQEDLDDLLAEYARPAATRMDAERAFADGDRLFVVHEQAEEAREVFSVDELAPFTPDQILILPASATLAQGARGTFNPQTLELVLNPNADLSTWFHETGHFFLEVLADVASQPDAPAQIVEDYNKVLAWFGVTPEQWASFTLDQKRPYHERWAESIEQYVMEGKAPSVELQPVMRRFSAWLKSVYQSIKAFVTGKPELQLNDDIRRVMDRMLATDEQIAQANEVAGLMPDEQADAEAAERLQKRSMADLKWAVKARDKVIAKLKRQAREIEKAIREQVTVEVDQMPEMRAKAKLDELRKTSPEYKAALKAWQTQRQAAKDAAAQSIRDNLLATEGAGLKGLEKGQFLARKKREIENQAEAAALAWEADNAKPERPLAASDLEVAAIADSFPEAGWDSVDAMLQAIDAFGKRADAIDGLTEQRMLEEHGDLVDERAIQEAANEAVHNEARARSLATELRTQREMLGGRTDTGEVNARGAKITVNTLVEAAKQFGANVIARTPLKDLRYTAWKHTAAERRAGKRWAEATAAGDTQAAVQAKQDQVLNNAAAKAALDAATEAKKILEFFRRVTKGNDEKTVEKGRDPDIVNAARAVLAAYGIETPTTKGAAAYLEAVKTNDPDTYAAIEPMITAATQNAQPLEALTFEELQGLAESIQAMWHLAKRSRQMEVDGDLMDIDDVAGELFVRLEEIGIPDRVPGEGMAVTREEERGLFLKQGIAFLRRVEQWAEGMDGKYGGPFLRFIFQPIKDAADRYRAERITYRKKFQALVDNLAPIVGDSVIDAPELGYKFGTPGSTAGTAMNEILHAIAHTGNDSNKRKLLLGRGWATENPDGTLDTSRWDAFIRRLVNEGKLERAHFDFVQGVWDLLEETKPLAQKAHRDAFGRYFSEVTADAFVDPFGVTRRGGYVPAQVDSRLVKDNALRKMAEEENNSMAYAFPQPAKGFTMGRTEYNRPLMLDLRSLSQHLDKVLLFSHMTNPARDVRKLLTRKTVSQPLDRIQPAAIESMLQPWLQRSAQQIVETPIVGSGKWARLPGLIRARAGMALMFANVSNAIQQVTGLAGAAVRVKPSMLMRSVAQYVANPVQFSRAVWDASPYMDDRAKNEVAVMNEQMQAILLKPSTYEKVQDWSMRHAYFLQTALDNVLSPIVWTGAFNQALAEGMSDADAVRFADSTVRQTQGSTLPEDVSRFETGPAYARAFTQFVGYFNMMANTNGTALKQIAGEVGLKKGAGKALYVVLMGLMVPIWVAEAIALAFKGGPEDEDDDGYLDDWLASVFGMGTSKGLLAQIPILGQFAVAAIQRFNDNPLDDRVSLSPAISLLESSVGAPQSVYKAIVEDGSAQKAIRDVATLVSVATGVPVYGLARPVGYAAGVAQGKIEPTSAADAARGVVTGTASPESKQR